MRRTRLSAIALLLGALALPTLALAPASCCGVPAEVGSTHDARMLKTEARHASTFPPLRMRYVDPSASGYDAPTVEWSTFFSVR